MLFRSGSTRYPARLRFQIEPIPYLQTKKETEMTKDDAHNLTRTIERLKRIIEEEELADDAKSSQRHAWFPYMAAVLEVYLEMKAREVAKKESKLMCKITGVKNGARLKHSIRRIIAATSKADGKAASKMTLASRYALHEHWDD